MKANKANSIENIVLDEANHRRYVILAPRTLSDGEVYRAIRQELLKRGGKPLALGATLTLTLTSTGGIISAVETAEPQTEPSNSATLDSNETATLAALPAPA